VAPAEVAADGGEIVAFEIEEAPGEGRRAAFFKVTIVGT